jgi:hypothetical protein
MLTICIGPSRKRLQLQCTRFYTQAELFKMTREQSRNSSVWFEYGPNLYQPINSDSDLRFVCNVLEGDINSYMSCEDREQNKRDVADAVHTQSFEHSIRGRRTSFGSKKLNSMYDTGHKPQSTYVAQDIDPLKVQHPHGTNHIADNTTVDSDGSSVAGTH